jgi:hypothetical protein
MMEEEIILEELVDGQDNVFSDEDFLLFQSLEHFNIEVDDVRVADFVDIKSLAIEEYTVEVNDVIIKKSKLRNTDTKSTHKYASMLVAFFSALLIIKRVACRNQNAVKISRFGCETHVHALVQYCRNILQGISGETALLAENEGLRRYFLYIMRKAAKKLIYEINKITSEQSKLSAVDRTREKEVVRVDSPQHYQLPILRKSLEELDVLIKDSVTYIGANITSTNGECTLQEYV